MTTRLVLTDSDYNLVLVDMDHVICACSYDGATRLFFDDEDWLDVNNSVEEIVGCLVELEAL